MPKLLFWEWTWRTILRVATFSFAVGMVWAALSIPGFGITYDISSPRFILAFLMDTVFIYLVTFMCFMIGLAMQTWGEVFYMVKLGRKEATTGFYWAMFLNLLVNLLAVKIIPQDTPSVTVGSVLFTSIVTAFIAQQTAYSVYYRYGVLDRTDRREYIDQITYTNRWKKLLRLVFPLPKRGVLFGSMFTAPLLLLMAVWLSGLVAQATISTMMGLALSMALGLLYGLFGLLIRFFDAVRPGEKRESLYPYFETIR